MQEQKATPATLFDFGPLARDYDRWYDTAAGRSYDRLQKAEVRQLLPPGDRSSRLLDVGCGTGHWSEFFAELGYLVHGVDISEEMIAVAQAKRISGCTFAVADALRLPLADGSFQVVAAMATLEFLTDITRALQEMARCASPAGSLLVGTLNRLAPLNQARVAEGKEPYSSARMLAAQELQAVLSPLGTVRLSTSSSQQPSCPFMVAEVTL